MTLGKAAGFVICVSCVPAIQGCIATAVPGAVLAQDRRIPGAVIDDQLIELKVLAAIDEDERLRSRSHVHVNVTSMNKRVLLTGEALGESLRARITEIAVRIPKVKDVQNRIEVAAPSSLLSRSKDSLITGKVKTALFGNNDLNLKARHVKVVTERGTVYLMGLLTQAEAEQATEIARRVGGVRRVVKFIEHIE